MSRSVSRLSSLSVQRISKSGRHPDGGGLYLQIAKAGTKSWIFRYMLNGKAREMGLGPLSVISLSDARKKALECRKQLIEGIDPIEDRRKAKLHRTLETAMRISFEECATAYIDSHCMGWKNKKHASQWRNTIATYANPIVGNLPVQMVDVTHMRRVLEPIWYEKTETASRVRNRMEVILDWATALGYRAGDNPARWKGHLDKVFPKRSLIQKVEHHLALPMQELGSFIANLKGLPGISPMALEFLILTATRTSETIYARWEEINFEEQLWTIPASRMKAKREHRVPLSPRALEILKALKLNSNSENIFPGWTKGKPLSNMALLSVIRKQNLPVTSHGFRSTFRDWAAERTNHPREVVESALAHTIGNKVEAAYLRSDLFLRRRALMNDWARFCSIENQAKEMNLVPLTPRQA